MAFSESAHLDNHDAAFSACIFIKIKVVIHAVQGGLVINVPVTRAVVTAPAWRTSPRRSWRPTARAYRPGSSLPWSLLVGLLRPQPISPSTWPGERRSGRTLSGLAAASFSQRSWSGGRTRLSSRSSPVSISPAADLIYNARPTPRTRGDEAVKFLILGQSWCKCSVGSAPPGWDCKAWGEEKVCPIRGLDSDHPRHSTRASTSPTPSQLWLHRLIANKNRLYWRGQGSGGFLRPGGALFTLQIWPLLLT